MLPLTNYRLWLSLTQPETQPERKFLDFSTEIINSVKEKFGIELEREVNII
jgi:hypothetical protein